MTIPYQTTFTEQNPSARNWAMFTHLSGLASLIVVVPLAGIWVPLILWLAKRKEFAFVDRSGKEALNFQITCVIYSLIAGLLCLVFIGFILLPIVVLFWFIFTIIGTVRAANGDDYRYPLTLRLVN
jgi:uncharacterized Tic20 family protein